MARDEVKVHKKFFASVGDTLDDVLLAMEMVRSCGVDAGVEYVAEDNGTGAHLAIVSWPDSRLTSRTGGEPPAAETPGPGRQQLALHAEGGPACPKCGSKMWDNRASKRNPRAPDYRCTRSREGCDGVVWPDTKVLPITASRPRDVDDGDYIAERVSERDDEPPSPLD